ncbi:MAG: phosphoribosylformylglycinamidine synthase I [Desulfotomaculales bacterium]
MLKPRVCVLRADGTNCDEETAFAFAEAGAEAELVHVNQLRWGERRLRDYHILVIPGGFSYGDDIRSGKILAVELTSYLKEELFAFVEQRRPVLGICNGFQVLVHTGLLPYGEPHTRRASLVGNDSGQFECRWVDLVIGKSPCLFTAGLEGRVVTLQVAHAEGKFYAPADELETIEARQLVVFRYADTGGRPTETYPANPNGSLHAIAGICNPSGTILGLMPHPERYVKSWQYANWRRGWRGEPHGLAIFQNAVAYARQM